VCLLGYYGHEAYKLLDRATGSVFKSRDVIFEEGQTHFARQPVPTRFSEEDDPFPITAQHEPDKTNPSENTETHYSDIQPTQGIAPRPHSMQDLHPQDIDSAGSELQPSPKLESGENPPLEMSLALRRV